MNSGTAGEEPLRSGTCLAVCLLRKVAGPYSRETFSLKLPVKEKAEVLVGIFNKSTDRFQPNSFHYQPARAPYRLYRTSVIILCKRLPATPCVQKDPSCIWRQARIWWQEAIWPKREEQPLSKDSNQESDLAKNLSPEQQEQAPVVRSDFEKHWPSFRTWFRTAQGMFLSTSGQTDC